MLVYEGEVGKEGGSTEACAVARAKAIADWAADAECVEISSLFKVVVVVVGDMFGNVEETPTVLVEVFEGVGEFGSHSDDSWNCRICCCWYRCCWRSASRLAAKVLDRCKLLSV